MLEVIEAMRSLYQLSMFAAIRHALTTTRERLGLLGATATSISIALATPALAAPAGDEYLESVPKAQGKEVIANPKHRAGASVVSPPVRGSAEPRTRETGQTGSSAGDEKGPSTKPAKNDEKRATTKPAKNDEKRATTKPAKAAKILANPAAPAGSPSESGGNSIFNPIVLLVIAGVIAAAAGMTLRRRQDGPEDQIDVREHAPEQMKNPRPTPDGEIVAGSEKSP
jgi:Mg-chelatase subunit ChlI